jgi:DNA-binding PadR family transcriptional regulator
MSHAMFNRALAAVDPRRAAARLRYVVLAYRCNDQSECWPSIARLHRDTGISARRIYRLLRQLERDGLLTIRPPRRGRRSNTYRLTRRARLHRTAARLIAW